MFEFGKFLDHDENQQEPEFEALIEPLFYLCEQRSFSSQFFKKEKYAPPTCAFFYSGQLRLYGCLYGSEIFVAGNGDIKNTPTIQQDPQLNTCYEDIKIVEESIDLEIIEKRSIKVGVAGFIDLQTNQRITYRPFNLDQDD